MINAKRIIDKRKQLWQEHNDIDIDRQYRDSTATYLTRAEGKELRKEVQKNPEHLVEMFFCIVDKEQQTVPFFFNAVQQEFLNILNEDLELYAAGKKLHLKYLVLKGRQQGFTSLINAYQLACAITRKNFSSYTLADNNDNTEHIFSDKARYYFDNLPANIKPSTRYSSRRELDFSKDGGGGMNSKWRVSTAGNVDAGRSKTLNFFHGSEVAFWKDSKHILIGLSEAFTKNAIVILETTANGYNEFKDMWDEDNNYTNLFFEWWKTDEYKLTFESDKIEREFVNNVMSAVEETDPDAEMWVLYRCKWLRKAKELSWTQLYWYYNKWKDKRSSIRQEYPCGSEEAFIATGRNYFNMENVARRLDELKEIGRASCRERV